MEFFGLYHLPTIFGMIWLNTDGCQVSRLNSQDDTPVNRLRAAVFAARERSRDGVIDLSSIAPPSEMTSAQRTVRPRTGSTVNFTCVFKPVTMNATNKFSQDFVVWRHQGALIYTNTTPPKMSKSYFYSFSRVGSIHLLFIHNVSYESAGIVQCLYHCFENASSTLCLNKEYHIRPKLKVENVFIDTMRNVSTSFWEVKFDCKARILYSGEYPNIIWKYDRIFSTAPSKHFLAALMPKRNTEPQLLPKGFSSFTIPAADCYVPSGEDAFCQQTAKVTFYREVNPGATFVECWVQPDHSIEEYFVQTAYVEFR